MKYYSTNHNARPASLAEAVVHGLASDRGLYMPEHIQPLPASFFQQLPQLSFVEISYKVAEAFFGDDVPQDALYKIVADTLAFDTPLIRVSDSIFALELFHGPTLAFKDVGARFMARLLQWVIGTDEGNAVIGTEKGDGQVHVLVATSGDTGSAVANGFLGVDNIHVHVLYPKGKVSPIQECQFTTLGKNVSAIEVDGVFDDCQALVKQAFMDKELNNSLALTSANSINVARFLPQAFYYFNAYAQAQRMGLLENSKKLTVCVPSGNFGNITAGLFAYRMGLPIHHFIAANNANDIFYQYLCSGDYQPKASLQTLANAMDVGNPSNFARIIELYNNDIDMIRHDISGAAYTDYSIARAMRQCYLQHGYVLDPHGACGYQALVDQLASDEVGIFLETAHPAKFKEKVDAILQTNIAIPERLAAFMQGSKQSISMPNDYGSFKDYLLK